MGGFGSGRWGFHSKKSTVEDGLILSAGVLKDVFRNGRPHAGSVYWSTGGKRVSSIGYEYYPEDEAGRLRLRYTTKRGIKQVESDYWIRVVSTPCNFGGRRFWYTCPLIRNGKPCGRRCGKLYCPGNALYFGCRECYDLTYTSCQESHRFDTLFAHLAAGTPYTPVEMKRVMNNGF